MSELIAKMRAAFQSLAKPDLDPTSLPPVPDASKFSIAQGSACAENDKAISIEIQDTAEHLTITLCSMLEFDFQGSLNAEGLLDSIPNAVSLDINSLFSLKGALMLGA